jgi:hypothetical protein
MVDVNIPISFATPLKFSSVIADLMATTAQEQATMDVIDYSRLEHVELGPAQILSSILEASAVIDWSENPHRHRSYAVLSLPMKPKGVGACQMSIPEEIRDRSLVHSVKMGKEKVDSWSSTISPSGAVTPPHLDYHGATQLMYHIGGHKLWLLWPPTEKNLQWYRTHRDRLPKPEINTTLEAIEKLEGMRIHYAKPSDNNANGFIVPPYGLHAVLSFTPSTHTGARFWRYEDFSQAMVGLGGDIEWSGDPEKFGFGIRQGLPRLKDIEDELQMWGRLCKEKPDPQYSSDILQVINELRNDIARYRKILNQRGN